MTARPSPLPSWSTDTNFTNGPQVGTPTKVDPGTGKRAEGWLPTERPAAQHWNHHFNLQGKWVEFLDGLKSAPHLSIRQLVDAVVDAHTSGLQDIFFHPTGANSGRPLLMACGQIVAGATNAIKSSLGGRWELVTLTAGLTNPRSVAADTDTASLPTWVIVGDNGVGAARIQESTDAGATWTARASTITGELLKVRWGNGLFVVLGGSATTGDEIETSPDGITWTNRANPVTPAGLNDLHFAAGKWVAVGSTGEVITSPDGITWTDRSAHSPLAGGAGSLYAVTYDAVAGLWVAAGSTGDVLTTPNPDTTDWTPRTGFLATDTLTSLAYNGDGVVMVVGGASSGAGSDIVGVSHDGGVTWDRRVYDWSNSSEAGLANSNAVAHVLGRWVIAGRLSSAGSVILSSGVK